MPIEKRWKVLSADDTTVAGLQQSLKINNKLCRILAQRNISTFDLSKALFRPQIEDLHDPWLLKDMDKARLYYTKLVELKGEEASKRESLAHAKQILQAS